MDGILNINKPAGKTSFNVVSVIRRLSREKRVGHAGTLDPFATGVLPVLLGQATRVAEYILEARKTYRGKIELGLETDTYDITGKVVTYKETSDISRERLEEALQTFRGEIEQVPPVYSALKQGGSPMYALVRQGIHVEPRARKTTIYRLDLIDYTPPHVVLDIECSRGTYIRSIAHDLGALLGSGGTLTELVRLNYGIFNVQSAVSLEAFAEAVKAGFWSRYVYPMDSVLESWDSLIVDDSQVLKLIQGNSIQHDMEGKNGERRRAYGSEGCFLGIVHADGAGNWLPEKIFRRSS